MFTDMSVHAMSLHDPTDATVHLICNNNSLGSVLPWKGVFPEGPPLPVAWGGVSGYKLPRFLPYSAAGLY